jgi:hypothetical protein
VDIYSAFIEAYMKLGGESIRHALVWFDKMRKQQIKPNLTTHTILIKGFLRSDTAGRVRLLLMEMLREEYSISAFMLNRDINNDELEMLNLIHKTRERERLF